MENERFGLEDGQIERIAQMQEAVAAYESAPEEHPISDMHVLILYKARIRVVEHHSRGGEHIFRFTRQETGPDERSREIPNSIKAMLEPFRVDDSAFMDSESMPRNAHAILKEFLGIKENDITRTMDFLSNTGVFSPLSDEITWTEIKRWKRFAKLVQEHSQLAAAMSESQWSGECGEVLKALTGSYPSSFFDGSEIPQTPSATEFDARLVRDHPKEIQEGRRLQERHRRELYTWFRQPPCSFEWIPATKASEEKILKTRIDHESGLSVLDIRASPFARTGAMIEFLLPKKELRPVIVVRPAYTLQAIAAAIYADRIQGVEWRKCGWEGCSETFKIGSRGAQRFCIGTACRENARSQRKRQRRKDKTE